MWMSAKTVYHNSSQRMKASPIHLSCLHVFLTYLFDILRYFTIQLASLLAQCNACQVDIGVLKVVFIFLHIRISVWIYLVGGAPVIDLPGSRDRATSECLSASGNWAITMRVNQHGRWNPNNSSIAQFVQGKCHKQANCGILPLKVFARSAEMHPHWILWTICFWLLLVLSQNGWMYISWQQERRKL